MAKQTFTTGQVLTAAQMTSLQQTAMLGGAASAKTASYTLVAADAGTAISMNSASATTITVNTALFAAGDLVQITNLGAGVCTITAGTATVDTAASLALAQYESGALNFISASAAIFIKGAGAAAASGGMTLISETVLSANSGLNLTAIPGTHKQLLLVWFGVKHSINGSTFNLRLNNDSTASIYQHAQWGQTTNTDTNDRGAYSSIGLNGAAPYGDDASEADIYQSAAGEFLIDNYASSTKTKAFFGRWTYKDNAANAAMYGQLIGSYNSTTAITSVDVVRMTGSATLTNQTNTSVRLYGIS